MPAALWYFGLSLTVGNVETEQNRGPNSLWFQQNREEFHLHLLRLVQCCTEGYESPTGLILCFARTKSRVEKLTEWQVYGTFWCCFGIFFKVFLWLGLAQIWRQQLDWIWGLSIHFMNCLEVAFERLVKFCFWTVLRTDYWGSTLWFSRRAAHWSGMCLWRRCWYMHSHLDSSIDDDSGMFHLTVVKQWQWCGMHTIFSIQ